MKILQYFAILYSILAVVAVKCMSFQTRDLGWDIVIGDGDWSDEDGTNLLPCEPDPGMGTDPHLPFQLAGGLTLKQINTALSLVSVAENSDTKWWNQYNYIENIRDNRGYTISIVGFCTGTGDFIQVLLELQKINPKHSLVKFIPLVRGKRNGDVKGLDALPAAVKAIGTEDQEFNQAAWIIIQKLYWGPAMEFCKTRGFLSPLAKYIVYDTILNFGELSAFETVIKVSDGTGGERSAIARFLDIKQRMIEKDSTLGESKNNRVDMQKKLLGQNNMDLTTPITVSCYGDTFTIL